MKNRLLSFLLTAAVSATVMLSASADTAPQTLDGLVVTDNVAPFANLGIHVAEEMPESAADDTVLLAGDHADAVIRIANCGEAAVTVPEDGIDVTDCLGNAVSAAKTVMKECPENADVKEMTYSDDLALAPHEYTCVVLSLPITATELDECAAFSVCVHAEAAGDTVEPTAVGSNPVTVRIPRLPSVCDLPFEDVPHDAWYYYDVTGAYSLGIIKGESETVFAPDDDLTGAEAVKLASVINRVFSPDAGDGTDAYEFPSEDAPWYAGYVEHGKACGILTHDIDYDAPITRGMFAELFANCLPEEQYAPINYIVDGGIADVPTQTDCHDAVYKLYRAGITMGVNEKREYHPNDLITRAEASAIVTRMYDACARVEFVIGERTYDEYRVDVPVKSTEAEPEETPIPEETPKTEDEHAQRELRVYDPGVRIIKAMDPVVTEGKYQYRYTVIDPCDGKEYTYYGNKTASGAFDPPLSYGDAAKLTSSGNIKDKLTAAGTPYANVLTSARYWITDIDLEEEVIEICTAGDGNSPHYMLSLDKTPVIRVGTTEKTFGEDLIKFSEHSLVMPEQLEKKPKELLCACTDYFDPNKENARAQTKYAMYLEAYIGISWANDADHTAENKYGTNGTADYIVIFVHGIPQKDVPVYCAGK